MIQQGFQVVFRSGKDKSIYQVSKIDGEMCDIRTYTSDKTKQVSLATLREAEDVEIMIGYRINK